MMRFTYLYEYKAKIAEEETSFFDEHHKMNLNAVEKYGLDCSLKSFWDNYEELTLDCHETDITGYTDYFDDRVAILFPKDNIFVFDNYVILSIWMTDEDDTSVILECRDISDLGDESVYSIDIFSKPRALFKLG